MHSRRKLLFISAGMLLALLVLSVLEVYRLSDAYHDLSSARATFTAVQNSLLSADKVATISAAEVAHTRTQTQDASRRLHHAAAVVGDDPLLALAEHLPAAGQQVRAARRLAALGADLGEIGVESGGVLDALQRARDLQGVSQLEKIEPALVAIQPNIDRIDRNLQEVHRLRDGIATGGLVAPLRDALKELDKDLPRADEALASYHDALSVLPAALGYERPRTYLVLARDSSELLGSGGYALAYGLLTMDHGTLTRNDFADTNFLREGDWPPKDPENYVTPPAALTKYLLHGWPMSLGDASWWLDFPTLAQQAIRIYQLNSRDSAPIDGVIGIDSYTLEALLRVIGPLTLDQFGLTVTANNVIRQELVLANPPPGTTAAVIRQGKEFGVALGSQSFERLRQLPFAQWPQLSRELQALVLHQDVSFWDSDVAVQRQIDRFGAAGRVAPEPGSDFVMVADASVGISKMNLVVRLALTLDVALQEDGSADDRLTLSYSSPFRAWREKDAELAAAFAGDTHYFGDYIRVLAPADAQLVSVLHDGKPVARPEPVTMEAGHREFAMFMALGENLSSAFLVTSHTQQVVHSDGTRRQYRLVLKKQPGTEGGTATVTVHPPAGWVIQQTLVDGRAVPSTAGVVSTDLTQDRVLTVRLVQGG